MPEEFKEDKSKAEAWLSRVETYLRLLKGSYPTDEDKVLYALYQMETHCKSWVDKYKLKLYAQALGWSTWKDFKVKFTERWVDDTALLSTRLKLDKIKQGGKGIREFIDEVLQGNSCHQIKLSANR